MKNSASSLIESNAATANLVCYHCGEPCDDDSISIAEKPFCCYGCRTVYELLEENGLCGYYDFAERGAISFKRPVSSGFEYLDESQVRSRLLQFSDGHLGRATLRLPQIHCASCVWLLENLYKINPNILRSEVNLLRKQIAVSFREDRIRFSEVVALLAKLGYEPEIRFDSITSGGQTGRVDALDNRRLYLKIGLAGFAFGNVMLFSFPDYLDSSTALSSQFKSWFGWLSIALSTPVLFYSASDYFTSSWYSLKQRRISLDVPVAMGITALYFRSVYDILAGAGSGYLDSFTGLVFFLLVGRIFQKKTFDALSFDREYAAYFPLSTAIVRDGREEYIPVSRLGVGDEIFVRHQGIVPADSVLLSAETLVDYSFVTGEAAPVTVRPGTLVYAGGRMAAGGSRLKVTRAVSHSYLTQLWNNDIFRKKKTSSLLSITDRFGRYFTYAVMAIAVGAGSYWLPDMGKAVSVFTAVLIIACPCALTLAAPFALGAAVAIFGKAKFYLKNVGVVPDLAALDAIVFDKTGTLTRTGGAEVVFVGGTLSGEEERLVAACLRHSSHPLGRQILDGYFRPGQEPASFASALEVHPDDDTKNLLAFRELAGKGIEGRKDGRRVALGSKEWIAARSDGVVGGDGVGSSVHLEIDGCYRGYFRVGAAYREGLIDLLGQLGKGRELFLLSGDNDTERANLSDLFRTEQNLAFHQRPEDKLDFVKRLQTEGRLVAMIGDGLNDAGALRQSNVGIALTEDAAGFTPACDAILAAENIGRLPVYLRFSRYALRVLFACFLISVLYNVVGLAFAVTGKLSPLVTAIFMPVSSLSVIAIAWGAMKIREKEIVG